MNWVLLVLIIFASIAVGFALSWFLIPPFGSLIITAEVPKEGDPFDGIEGITKDVYQLELSDLDLTKVKGTEYVRLKLVRK